MLLWLASEQPVLRSPWLVAPWTGLVALLMVSSLPTFAWSAFRLRRQVRFEAIALVVFVGAAFVSAPWATLAALSALYFATLPFSAAAYGRIRRRAAMGLRTVPSPPSA